MVIKKENFMNTLHQRNFFLYFLQYLLKYLLLECKYFSSKLTLHI